MAGKPAFTIPKPEPLRSSSETRWAPVRRAAQARATPGGRRIAELSTMTPEGTTNLVTLTGRLRTRAGVPWVQARLPVLPNGTTGWVPRRALGGYRTVQTRLQVDRRRLTAELFRGRRRIFTTRVGIGQDRWPTPAGRFYVRVKLTRYASPTYGPLAFGLSARSAVLTDWPAGGFVGIHGTDQPELLPGRVSHGCIRMRNEAIVELGRLMPVGTPVIVT
jgi:lipoprotein-anchoring transpeptidase ErfK/SrfK